MYRWVLVLLLVISISVKAQKKWDGGGNSDAWGDPLNWVPDGIPRAQDQVILDHQWVQQDYKVLLPGGNTSIEIHSLFISPSAGQITVMIPTTNTAVPALRLNADGDGLVIHQQGIFVNASAAASGSPLQLIGKLRINNGGKYVHQTLRGNAELIDKLSDVAGTETGIFEFDVPGTAGYTVSLTGNRFGSLSFHAKTAGGTKSYSGSGTSDLTIRGDLTVHAGASITSTLTADILLGGHLVAEGKLNLHPVSAGTTGRSLIFTGSNSAFRGSGLLSTNAFFRNILISKSTELLLERDCILPFTSNNFICQGILHCGRHIISGAGTFILSDSARITLGSDSGITASSGAGNIQTSVRSLSRSAHYVFAGTAHQFTGDGVPDTVASITVENALHLALSKALAADSLLLVIGKLKTDSTRMLDLTRGIIRRTAGSNDSEAFIEGPFQFHVLDTAMQLLPVGAGELFAPLQVKKPDPGPVYVRVSFSPGQTYTGFSPSLSAITHRGFWSFSSSYSGPWIFGLSYQPADSSIYPGLDPVPAALKDVNGVLQWQALSGQPVQAQASFGWLYTDTAVRDLTALTTGYTISGLLPLRLIDFRSEKHERGIRLTWKADQDNHPAVYTLERGKDGRTFTPLSRIKAGSSGLSLHSWVDEQPLEPYNYYRLYIEGSGGGSYSFMIRESFTRRRARMYPNPVTDKIHIYFPDRSSGSYIDIVNSSGAVLRRHFVKTTNCIIGVSDLPSGAYIIRFRGTNNPANLHFTKY
jgi:hypothetical protein